MGLLLLMAGLLVVVSLFSLPQFQQAFEFVDFCLCLSISND